jgi:hypothetical protein
MKRALPYVVLWLSLTYTVVILGVMGKICFDSMRAIPRTAAGIEPGFMLSKKWVAVQADNALDQLFGLCLLVGLGLLFIAVSAAWVTLARPEPPPASRWPAGDEVGKVSRHPLREAPSSDAGGTGLPEGIRSLPSAVKEGGP